MVRLELKLLTGAESDAKIAAANALADKSFNHLKKLIGTRKCHKHPSYVNKIKIIATKDGNPKVEIVDYCCPDFNKAIS